MPNFSYQLYSSRNFPPLTNTLRMLAEAGYTEVEGFGSMLASPEQACELKAQLNICGLTMPTAHAGLDILENDPANLVAAAQELGIRRVYCPHLSPELRPQDAAGWAAFGERLVELGAPLRDAGIGMGWHNHDFEFKFTSPGVAALDDMFSSTAALEWQIDVAWLIVARQDPLEWIEKYGSMITAVHIKDIAPQGECADEDGWADPGCGTVDWPAIMAALDRYAPRIEHFVLEHDNPNDDRRFATRGITNAAAFVAAPQ